MFTVAAISSRRAGDYVELLDVGEVVVGEERTSITPMLLFFCFVWSYKKKEI